MLRGGEGGSTTSPSLLGSLGGISSMEARLDCCVSVVGKAIPPSP